MKTKYIISNDGARIAYTVTGDGPALLLVHGGVSIFDKQLWVDMKWIEQLKDHFTIIAPDIRGNGESDKSEDPAFYSLNNILNDFNAILEACNAAELYYYGWSYGATLGFQLMKDNARIRKAVCSGSFMGSYFFRNTVPGWLKEFEELNYHKKNSSLDRLELTAEERTWAEETNLDLRIAQFKAWAGWPGIEPSEIQAKLAIYSGTKDSPVVLEQLSAQQAELAENNITVKIFEGLDHRELISKVDTVIPWILQFFNEKI